MDRTNEILETSKDTMLKMGLPVLLGEACDGIQFVALHTAPHILVAGGTKGERDAFLRQAMRSICATRKSGEVEFYLFGNQMDEWPALDSVRGVYCDAGSISAGMDMLVSAMEYRYEKLCEKHRGKASFEALRSSMPFVVALIDGIGRNMEKNVLRLCAKGRAVGIHLILSAQSASKKVIPGRLTVNFPARVAFRTETAAESKNLIYREGAECLAGGGDMLFADPWGIQRVQMCREE